MDIACESLSGSEQEDFWSKRKKKWRIGFRLERIYSEDCTLVSFLGCLRRMAGLKTAYQWLYRKFRGVPAENPRDKINNPPNVVSSYALFYFWFRVLGFGCSLPYSNLREAFCELENSIILLGTKEKTNSCFRFTFVLAFFRHKHVHGAGEAMLLGSRELQRIATIYLASPPCVDLVHRRFDTRSIPPSGLWQIIPSS